MRQFNTALIFFAVLALAGCGSREEEEIEQPTAVSVRVTPATATEVQPWVYAQGTARAYRREFLTFASAGRVAYVNPNLRVGSPIRRGQVIAYQEPERVQADVANAEAGVVGAQAELTAARAAQDEARANLELARVTFERYRILIEQNSASQQELDQARAQLEQAEAALQRANAQIGALQAQVEASRSQVSQAQVLVSESRMVSPINGVIGRLNIEQGQYFTPQIVQTGSEQAALRTIPALVIDPAAFEINVDLPSYYFRQIQIGSSVVIGVGQAESQPASGGGGDGDTGGPLGPPLPIGEYQVRGRVHAISPSLDPETRTFEAVIRTTAGHTQLQDGEFVATWIAGPTEVNALVVPLDALRFRDGQGFVFVVDREGVAHEREVALGQQSGNQQVVLSGLRAGEMVVTEGRARLTDGTRVRVLGRQPARREQQ
jgi:RND family efflux transporter MFP subunit